MLWGSSGPRPAWWASKWSELYWHIGEDLKQNFSGWPGNLENFCNTGVISYMYGYNVVLLYYDHHSASLLLTIWGTHHTTTMHQTGGLGASMRQLLSQWPNAPEISADFISALLLASCGKLPTVRSSGKVLCDATGPRHTFRRQWMLNNLDTWYVESALIPHIIILIALWQHAKESKLFPGQVVWTHHAQKWHVYIYIYIVSKSSQSFLQRA